MKQVFHVEGMHCAHCVRAITKAVLQLDPQAKVLVDLTARTVNIESGQPRQALAEVMAAEGYAVAT